MMLTLTFLIATLVGLISLVLMMRYRPPPKDHAALLYRKFTQKAGLPPNCGETPQDYASRLSEEREELAAGANRVTVQYLSARYGPPNPVAMDLLRAAVAGFKN
jgi:hypothetical protein